MNSLCAQEYFLAKLLDLLENHYGFGNEVVLHDLTLDYDRTIVDIRNGHITGRRIGDCGSNLGLEVLRGTAIQGDRYNYVTQTADAKVLRSSSMYMKDEAGNVIGALCINTDITESLKFETYLHAMNCYAPPLLHKSPEVFVKDVKQLLEHLLTEGELLVGKKAENMSKEERFAFIKYLDQKGAFLITKSSDRVCDFLGVSKYTLYTVLEKLRGDESKAHGGVHANLETQTAGK